MLVLGFDGADWRTTERMMDSGELPNMAGCVDGGRGTLVSTDPASRLQAGDQHRSEPAEGQGAQLHQADDQ